MEYSCFEIECGPFVSRAKHDIHIGIMSLLGIVSVVISDCHTFGFLLLTFEGMHQYIQSLQKGKALLNTGQERIW